MGRVFAILALVLCVGSLAANGETTAQLVNQVCQQMRNNQLLADPLNCNYYYRCLNGIGYSQECAAGYYFDKNAQICSPPNQVYCSANNNYACKGQPFGSSVTVNGNCNAYYNCSGADAPSQIGYCASTLNYNPISRQCESSMTYPCANYVAGSSDSLNNMQLCDYVQNGIAFNDPTACQKWFICQSNKIMQGSCAANYSFNALAGGCVYNTTCWQNLTDTTDLAPIGGQCSQTSATLAVPNSCNAYYLCNGAQYVLTYCSNDLYYDTVSGTCVSQLNARNNCNRCVNNDLQFVNQYSTTDCTGYIYCVNGAESSTGNCPSGYYFNQVAAACQYGTTEPAFGCCNPSVYGSGK